MKPDTKVQLDDSSEYQEAFRKKVFLLLKRGYDGLVTASLRSAAEEEITGKLVNKIRDFLEDRDSPTWTRCFTIHEDPPINSPGRTGKRRKRVDIEIERVGIGPRPRFSLEAKRLCSPGATAGKYLGPTGLGEFLSGNYASHQNEAGMIGYVQSDTPEAWSAKIKNQFAKKPKNFKTCSDGTWTNTVVIRELSYCFRSKHHRNATLEPITIFHTFLAFC